MCTKGDACSFRHASHSRVAGERWKELLRKGGLREGTVDVVKSARIRARITSTELRQLHRVILGVLLPCSRIAQRTQAASSAKSGRSPTRKQSASWK